MMYKKILGLAVLIASFLAFSVSSVSSVFAASHEQNFETFENSIVEVANKITWSGKHNFQDVEFVTNEMVGDETVYARAWYADYYLVIRTYTDKTWSKSFVSNFWTSSEELTFTNGIKVGASIEEVKAFFGKKHVEYSSSLGRAYVYREEGDSPGRIIFSTKNNRITSIVFDNSENMTSKMFFLFSLYYKMAFAEVTGEKVNVRKYTGNELGKDKVLFQVSKSKGDCLLVDPESPEKAWCYVEGRITNNSFKHEPRSCYISRQFLKIRDLTIKERNLYISQFLRK